MSTPSPGPSGEDPGHPQHQDYAFGRLYGRAPRSGGSRSDRSLAGVYTFVLVWFTTALIMVFGTRFLGIERGDLGAALVSLVVSFLAAVGITAWVRRR